MSDHVHYASNHLVDASQASSSDRARAHLAAAKVQAHLAIAEAIRLAGRDIAQAIHETTQALHEIGQAGWSAEDAANQLGEDDDD
jgi:predicted transcriptional regulator